MDIQQTVDARTVPLCSICGQPEANHPKVEGFHTFCDSPLPPSSSEEETRNVHEITPLPQRLPFNSES